MKEEKERKTVPNVCVSKGLSMRDGGLQCIQQIGKIKWLDESWIWNLKFYYFWQHGSTLKNGYVNDIFCLNRSTGNACSVLDLLTWRGTLPSTSFSCLSFKKKQHFFFVSKLDCTHARKKKTKARLSFLYYIGLMELLRLNYILLLRSPVRHGSWRDADFAAFLVPLSNLHKNINSQIQSWDSEHPCSQSFCAPWHWCPESEGKQLTDRQQKVQSCYWHLCKPLHTVQTN